jgi:predicted ATPase
LRGAGLGRTGIGKSRLTEAVQERLGAEPHTRLRFFCSPHHQDSALYPAISQLERAAGFRREDTAELRLPSWRLYSRKRPMMSAGSLHCSLTY